MATRACALRRYFAETRFSPNEKMAMGLSSPTSSSSFLQISGRCDQIDERASVCVCECKRAKRMCVCVRACS